MDSSFYVPTQTSPMTQPIGGSSSSNDQPVNFGPVLWDVLDHVGSAIGGAIYLIGMFFEIHFRYKSFHFVFDLQDCLCVIRRAPTLHS